MNLGEKYTWMLNHIGLATFLKVPNFSKFKEKNGYVKKGNNPL